MVNYTDFLNRKFQGFHGSPFTGVGSEGFVALQQGRNFVGFELKPSYYETAKRNLETGAQQLRIA